MCFTNILNIVVFVILIAVIILTVSGLEAVGDAEVSWDGLTAFEDLHIRDIITA